MSSVSITLWEICFEFRLTQLAAATLGAIFHKSYDRAYMEQFAYAPKKDDGQPRRSAAAH